MSSLSQGLGGEYDASRGASPPLAARRPRRRAPARVAVPALLIAGAVNLPLLYLLLRAADSGPRAFPILFSASSLGLLWRTLALVAGSLSLALAIAVPMAWLVARTDLRGRHVWALLGGLPLVFPSYVAAFALVAVLGPRGFVQGWLAPFGVERLPSIAYGYSGALLAIGLFTYPYLYLPLVAALRELNPALEESSHGFGSGRWDTFFRVILPQLRPSLYAGGLLIVLYAISDFGAVSITRYDTLTLSIYNAYRGLFDRGVAATLSGGLAVLALVFILVQFLLIRGLRPVRSRPVRPPRPVPLGRWQWPSQLFLAVVTLFTLGIPLGVILFWGIRAWAVGNTLGNVGAETLNSFGASFLAALVSAVLAIPVAAWAVRYGSKLAKGNERLCYAGYALPGLVVALSLVFFATRHAPGIYQTLGLLVSAYVVRFLPEALSATRAAMADVAPVFEEAARSLGRAPIVVFHTITVPLIRPRLLAGAGLVFLTSMKELPATLILRPIGFETLATRVWSAASEGVYSEAALPALLLFVVSALPIYLLVIRPALTDRNRPRPQQR